MLFVWNFFLFCKGIPALLTRTNITIRKLYPVFMKNLNVKQRWVNVSNSAFRLMMFLPLFLCTLAATAQQVARTLNYPTMGGYYEYLPQDYQQNTKKYPLLIFLHGMGEEGNGKSDISRLLVNGIPNLISQGLFPQKFTVGQQSFSFIVISPQFTGIPQEADLNFLMAHLKNNYRIDTNRIYMTGISRGGGATWGFASLSDRNSRQLAAIVPVCGAYGPNAAVAAVIARNNLPVWALHNDRDGVVPSQNSKDWERLINAYTPSPQPRAKLTIFDAGGHNAWTKSYDPQYRENGKNIYEWMLQFERNSPVAPTGGKRITLTPNWDRAFYYPDAQTKLNIQPGDTLCIPAGDYTGMHLGNITGTAEKPVVITNCGGLVRFGVNNKSGGGTTTVNFASCRFMEMAGTGDPNLTHGIDINGTNVKGESMFGIYATAGSSDFNLHHIYIHDAGMFVVAKTTQSCETPQYWESTYVMRNVKLHHIKGRNSQFEGFYIGNSHYLTDLPCGKAVKSHHIENLEVYDNDLENTGSDGIQIGMADMGRNTVHHNRLVNYGTRRDEQHGYGILIGGGSTAEVYNNLIDRGYYAAITFFGSGISRAYNNVISNIQYDGFLVAERLVLQPVTAYCYNNTLVKVGRVATVYANGVKAAHRFYNNLSVAPVGPADQPGPGYYIRGNEPIKYDFRNNPNFIAISDARFVDAARGNYRLQAQSPAVNAAADVAGYMPAVDFDGMTRPQHGRSDIGAFEFNEGGTKLPPQADAGAAVTVLLPEDKAILDGTSSRDPDGRIISYQWQQLAGPSTAVISTPSEARTHISALQRGVYTFQLVVTDNDGIRGESTVTATVRKKNEENPQDQVIIRLQPNPTVGDVKLVIAGNSLTRIWVTVYNVTGQVEMKATYPVTPAFTTNLNVATLPAGIHYVEVKGDNDFKWTGRLMKL